MHAPLTKDKPSPFEQRRRTERARIESLLTIKGLKLTDIDEAYGLPPGTASNTLAEPHIAGERAIAAALGRRPERLWRTRYHAEGERFRPQPAENYRRRDKSSGQQEVA